MSKRLKIVSRVLVCFSVGLVVIVATLASLKSETSANTNLVQTALYNALYTCYGKTVPSRGYLKTSINANDYTAFWPSDVVDNTTKVITLPGYYSSSGSDNKLAISCKEVFAGGNLNNTSVKRFSGLQDSNRVSYTPQDWGYSPDNSAGAASTKKCLYYTYDYFDGNVWTQDTTNGICLPVDSDGNIQITNPLTDITYMDGKEANIGDGKLTLAYNLSDHSFVIGYCQPSSFGCSMGVQSAADTVCSLYNDNCGPTWWSDFVHRQFGHVAQMYDANSCESSDTGECRHYFPGGDARPQPVRGIQFHTKDDESSTSTVSASYVLNSRSAAETLKKLTGENNFSKYYVNSDTFLLELYSSYYNAMKDEYPAGTLAVNTSNCSTDPNAYTYAMTSDGKNWCEVGESGVNQVTEKFAVANTAFSLKIGSFADVMSGIKKINMSNVDSGALDALPPDPGTSGGSTGGQPEENQPVDKCYTAAASLGWFLCPVLELTGKATSGIYDMVIEPFLQVKSSFFGDSNGRGLREGWSKFRNYANILFAIAFAVVIFSQVTGFGISNYNIKKILPRLIMVVVLVNISFILCQIAVDVSNIVGSSLQKMFEGFTIGISTPEHFSGERWFSLSGIISTVLTSGLLVGAGIAAAVTWEFWLIPLVLTVIACFISIIFFFLILGVRQAGIIILIAIAPVAIVCYALPNTKSLYDKWFKMFSALLMVYPICGLLIGGGQFASAMLISTGEGNFVFVLVAMLISVVPFFFIPSIVRSSMVAMGNIGAKMAAMGSGIGSRATSMLRNSSAVQDRQRQNMIHYNEKKTRGLLNKQQRRINAGKNGLGKGDQRRLARYGSALNRLRAEDMQAELAATSGNFATRGSAAESRMRQSMQTRQERDDIAAQQQIYESNGVDGVDVNNLDTVAAEYENQLNALDAAISSGDMNARNDASTKIKALNNILSGTDSGRGKVQAALNKHLGANAARYANSHDETALSVASGHLMANYAGDYKKANRGLYNMLGDLSKREYGHGMTVSGSGATYDPSHYNTIGVDGYTAQNFAGADEAAINGIVDSIENGTISDANLRSVTSLADEVLSNPKIELQPKMREKFQKIAAGGYARGAVSRSSVPAGTSTAGSEMIAKASNSSLDNIISNIQNSQAPDAQVQAMAENARRALESDANMHDEGTAERLQQVLAAAKARGIKDIDGHDFDPVDSATIKIRGQRQPKVIQKAPVPTGWTEAGLWTGPGAPTKQQQIAYDEWAKHSAEVDRHNSQVPPTP